MRVFVYEHLCTLPGVTSSLRAEGRAMLSAALADLAACAGVAVVTLVEPSLVETMRAISPRIVVYEIASPGTEQMFRRLARDSSFALVIAPEFDDILATRCEWALESGCRLLGPSPEAVRLCADKLRLAELLRGLGPETTLYRPDAPPKSGYPYVVKPRFGAGTQATFLVRSADDFVGVELTARAQGFEGELIVQEYCRGRPASVAVIATDHRIYSLAPAEQHIETTSPLGQLRYAGGAIQYPPLLNIAFILSECAHLCVPGLSGYFGVDIAYAGWDKVEGPGSIIEINPRLTTSYIGLRRLSNLNLMQLLLDFVQGIDPPPPMHLWRECRVRFDPDGTVYEE